MVPVERLGHTIPVQLVYRLRPRQHPAALLPVLAASGGAWRALVHVEDARDRQFDLVELGAH